MPRKTMTTKNLAQTTDDPEPEGGLPLPAEQSEAVLQAAETGEPITAAQTIVLPEPQPTVKVRVLVSFSDFSGLVPEPANQGDVFDVEGGFAQRLVAAGFVELV